MFWNIELTIKEDFLICFGVTIQLSRIMWNSAMLSHFWCYIQEEQVYVSTCCVLLGKPP